MIQTEAIQSDANIFNKLAICFTELYIVVFTFTERVLSSQQCPTSMIYNYNSNYTGRIKNKRLQADSVND